MTKPLYQINHPQYKDSANALLFQSLHPPSHASVRQGYHASPYAISQRTGKGCVHTCAAVYRISTWIIYQSLQITLRYPGVGISLVPHILFQSLWYPKQESWKRCPIYLDQNTAWRARWPYSVSSGRFISIRFNHIHWRWIKSISHV